MVGLREAIAAEARAGCATARQAEEEAAEAFAGALRFAAEATLGFVRRGDKLRAEQSRRPRDVTTGPVPLSGML